MTDYDLTGRTALVTGGARGLGAEMAAALARAGASVALGDIQEDLGKATADELKDSGANAIFCASNRASSSVGASPAWRASFSAALMARGHVRRFGESLIQRLSINLDYAPGGRAGARQSASRAAPCDCGPRPSKRGSVVISS